MRHAGQRIFALFYRCSRLGRQAWPPHHCLLSLQRPGHFTLTVLAPTHFTPWTTVIVKLLHRTLRIFEIKQKSMKYAVSVLKSLKKLGRNARQGSVRTGWHRRHLGQDIRMPKHTGRKHPGLPFVRFMENVGNAAPSVGIDVTVLKARRKMMTRLKSYHMSAGLTEAAQGQKGSHPIIVEGLQQDVIGAEQGYIKTRIILENAPARDCRREDTQSETLLIEKSGSTTQYDARSGLRPKMVPHKTLVNHGIIISTRGTVLHWCLKPIIVLKLLNIGAPRSITPALSQSFVRYFSGVIQPFNLPGAHPTFIRQHHERLKLGSEDRQVPDLVEQAIDLLAYLARSWGFLR